MKKRPIKFEVNFTNKWLYTFVFFGVVLMVAIGVFAYNSGKAPNVMGHSGEEIMVSVNGQDMTLNSFLSTFSNSNVEGESQDIVCNWEGEKTNGIDIKDGHLRGGSVCFKMTCVNGFVTNIYMGSKSQGYSCGD